MIVFLPYVVLNIADFPWQILLGRIFRIQMDILVYFELIWHSWKPFIPSYFVCHVSCWSLTLIWSHFVTCSEPAVVCLQFHALVSLFTSLQTREPLALYSETLPYSHFVNMATSLLRPLFSVQAKHPYMSSFFYFYCLLTYIILPT